jgi:chromosome segregation ATPase
MPYTPTQPQVFAPVRSSYPASQYPSYPAASWDNRETQPQDHYRWIADAEAYAADAIARANAAEAYAAEASARAGAAEEDVRHADAQIRQLQDQVQHLLEERRRDGAEIERLSSALSQERARGLSSARELDSLRDRGVQDRRVIEDLRRQQKDVDARTLDLEQSLATAEEQTRNALRRVQIVEGTLEDVRNEAKIPFVVPALFDTLRRLSEHTSNARS